MIKSAFISIAITILYIFHLFPQAIDNTVISNAQPATEYNNTDRGFSNLARSIWTTNSPNSPTIIYIPILKNSSVLAKIPGIGDLIFNDEFDGAILDTTKWHTDFWWATNCSKGATSYEVQTYTPNNISVSNGNLVLTARRGSYTCTDDKKTYSYTSGIVITGGRYEQKPPGFTFMYGYVEARIKIPSGRGFWPAFWLLPVDYKSRPEIDIMEMYDTHTTEYTQNVHFIDNQGEYIDEGNSYIGPDMNANFQVVGLLWEPTKISWYVDGVNVWNYTGSAIPNEPMYLLLNLALGNYDTQPDKTTPFPNNMFIDYVRVWTLE